MALISLTDFQVTRFVLAISLLLVSAHFFGFLFHYFKLPRVVGEITGGIVLGASGLGHLSPKTYDSLFNAFSSEGQLIAALYWFGLTLLMIIAGFDLETSLDRKDRTTVLALVAGTTVLPFAAGWLATHSIDIAPLLGTQQNDAALRIVIGIACAITAVPVISRIFLDLGIMHTPFAKIVLATATIHDVLLWVALAMATGLVQSNGFALATILSHVLETMAFIILVFMIGRRLMLPSTRLGAIKAPIKEVSLRFFIPLYFAIVGLKLDLRHHLDVPFFLTFLAFSTVVTTASAYVTSKSLGHDHRTSLNLAAAMNARGGVAIVLATVTHELGIISESFFVTLVLTAIVTALLAGVWFQQVVTRGWVLYKPAERRG